MATRRTFLRSSDSAPSTGWTPPGEEFPSTDLGPAVDGKLPVDGLIVAALTRRVGIEGHPDQLVSTILTYSGEATATVMYCTSEDGAAGCRPEGLGATWSISVSSGRFPSEASPLSPTRGIATTSR